MSEVEEELISDSSTTCSLSKDHRSDHIIYWDKKMTYAMPCQRDMGRYFNVMITFPANTIMVQNPIESST
jgi:hypothetical protein